MKQELEVELLKLIEHYRTRKNNTIFDDFYTSDLNLIETMLSIEETQRTSGKYIYEKYGLYIACDTVNDFKTRINRYRQGKNDDFTDIFYHVHLDYMNDLITNLVLVTKEEIDEITAKRKLKYTE